MKFEVRSSKFKFEVQSSKFKVQSSKFKVQSSKFKVQSSKFKVQSSKFKVQSSNCQLLTANSQLPTANCQLLNQLTLCPSGRAHHSGIITELCRFDFKAIFVDAHDSVASGFLDRAEEEILHRLDHSATKDDRVRR